jgi:hypothetical protein
MQIPFCIHLRQLPPAHPRFHRVEGRRPRGEAAVPPLLGMEKSAEGGGGGRQGTRHQQRIARGLEADSSRSRGNDPPLPSSTTCCSASTSTTPGHHIYASVVGLLCLRGGSSPKSKELRVDLLKGGHHRIMEGTRAELQKAEQEWRRWSSRSGINKGG